MFGLIFVPEAVTPAVTGCAAVAPGVVQNFPTNIIIVYPKAAGLVRVDR